MLSYGKVFLLSVVITLTGGCLAANGKDALYIQVYGIVEDSVTGEALPKKRVQIFELRKGKYPWHIASYHHLKDVTSNDGGEFDVSLPVSGKIIEIEFRSEECPGIGAGGLEKIDINKTKKKDYMVTIKHISSGCVVKEQKKTTYGSLDPAAKIFLEWLSSLSGNAA